MEKARIKKEANKGEKKEKEKIIEKVEINDKEGKRKNKIERKIIQSKEIEGGRINE